MALLAVVANNGLVITGSLEVCSLLLHSFLVEVEPIFFRFPA